MWVNMFLSFSHCFAKPKSQSFTRPGVLPSSSVLSSFRSLRGTIARVDNQKLNDCHLWDRTTSAETPRRLAGLVLLMLPQALLVFNQTARR